MSDPASAGVNQEWAATDTSSVPTHCTNAYPGGTPTPLASDQLVAAFGTRPDDDRLEEALLADRAGETGGRLGLEAAARLTRIRVDRVDGKAGELRAAFAGAADQDFQAAAATQIPVQRVGRPEDIADAVAYFTNERAGFVSGQVLYVAGGPLD